jgi:hypothetical protein
MTVPYLFSVALFSLAVVRALFVCFCCVRVAVLGFSLVLLDLFPFPPKYSLCLGGVANKIIAIQKKKNLYKEIEQINPKTTNYAMKMSA